MSEYRGESWPKKVARAYLWTAVTTYICARVEEAKFMVLSGPDAGDVATLVALGANPRNITAVDMDASAIASASREWAHRGVRFIHGKASDAARSMGGRVDVLFLDFCCRASDGLADEFALTLGRAIKPGGIAGFGISYGIGERLSDTSDRVRERCAQVHSEMGHYGDPCDWRVKWMQQRINDQSRARSLPGMCATLRVKYKSSGEDGRGGTPMVYAIGPTSMRGKSQDKSLISSVAGSTMFGDMNVPNARECAATLRELAVRTWAYRSSRDTAMFLNVPEGKVRAWRAVATRESRAAALNEAAE